MQLALFPDDRAAPVLDCEAVQARLDALELRKPRQWGACWLACHLWGQLRLDDFWADKLPPSRQGTRWLNVFKTLVCYRLIDPGSEWRPHRHWYEQSDKLYRCLDKLVAHKQGLFGLLRERWQALLGVRFDVLLTT